VLAVIGTGSSSSGPQKTVGTFNPEIQFAIRCAPCHGAGGRGGPNLPGPKLAGGAVVKAFPNIEDQITFVSNGKGDMPAFKDRLTPDELRQIVEYTRTL